MPVTIDREKCIGCGACLSECPVEAFDLDDENICVYDPEDCIECYMCLTVCPMEAIEASN